MVADSDIHRSKEQVTKIRNKFWLPEKEWTKENSA